MVDSECSWGESQRSDLAIQSQTAPIGAHAGSARNWPELSQLELVSGYAKGGIHQDSNELALYIVPAGIGGTQVFSCSVGLSGQAQSRIVAGRRRGA
jgi:hypothetical protein